MQDLFDPGLLSQDHATKVYDAFETKLHLKSQLFIIKHYRIYHRNMARFFIYIDLHRITFKAQLRPEYHILILIQTLLTWQKLPESIIVYRSAAIMISTHINKRDIWPESHNLTALWGMS